MKIAVIIYSNDPETVWNAFRFANTSLIYDNTVSVFLLGKGVEALTLNTFKYDILEQLEIFRSGDGIIVGCGVCCENRKEEMPLLQQELKCDMGSMQDLYRITTEADKVLTF